MIYKSLMFRKPHCANHEFAVSGNPGENFGSSHVFVTNLKEFAENREFSWVSPIVNPNFSSSAQLTTDNY